MRSFGDPNYPMYVLWEITRNCNQLCSYCPLDHSKKYDYIKKEVLFQGINKLAETDEIINIDFFGGEPTLHPDYIEVLKYADTHLRGQIFTTTNASRPIDYFKNIVDQVSPAKVQFTLTYHNEFCDVKSFREKIILLGRHGFKVNVTFVCHNEKFDEVKSHFEFLKDSPYSSFNLKPIWEYQEKKLYTDEYKHWIIENQLDDIPDKINKTQNNKQYFFKESSGLTKTLSYSDVRYKYQLNHFKNWECQAHKLLFIDQMGFIYKQCFKHLEKPMGNLFTIAAPDIVKNKNNYVNCPHQECTCDVFLHTHKKEMGK